MQLRNDRPHFESIRATSSVKTGKWYYETLLLSSGIMQLGWATSRCRFTPEEGYGVGDDCVSAYILAISAYLLFILIYL
jgi:hypothetical protein